MPIPSKLATGHRRLRLALESPVNRNITLLYAEVIAAGLLAAAGSFNGAYLLRLGGSSAIVGLLSSLPALVAVLMYLPAARILHGRTHYNRWIIASLAVARAGYLPLLVLPWLLSSFLPEASLTILVAMTVPSVLFSTGWSPFLSDVIPPSSRALVLSWRSILSSGTIALLTLFCGLWLNRVAFPINYQVMYIAGLLGGMLSIYLVARISLPEDKLPRESSGRERLGLGEIVRRTVSASPRFRRLIINTLFFNLGVWLVGPLYVILFVNELGASDAWLGLCTALANVGVVVGYLVWRRIIKRTGEAKALLYALPLVCSYAFLVALFPNLSFILVAGFLINIFTPGVNLSHSVIFLDLLPSKERYGATALYSMMMNIGAFICPLLGVFLASKIGLVPTLLVGGSMRVCGAALFYLFPIAGERPKLKGWLRQGQHG